jgi:PIN domain nuclease of toxin-antitoxin system
MQYLLDTHCLIWFQENNPKIPPSILEEIQKASNKIFFSQISLLEIAIKQKIGKLPSFQATLADVYYQGLKDDFTFLSIQNNHIETYDQIPLLAEHRDPFDRLLLATAATEQLTIITADKNFRLYPKVVQIFWED